MHKLHPPPVAITISLSSSITKSKFMIFYPKYFVPSVFKIVQMIPEKK